MKLKIKPLSQKSAPWGLKKLGFSNVSISGYGCVLVNCSMICNYFGHETTPDKLNEDMKRVHGYYNKNLWQWHKLTEIYPDIKFTGGLDFPNDPTPLNKIDKQLNKGFPVIAYLDYSSKPGIQTHFVLIVGKVNGDYLINDPLGGETYFFKAKYGDIVKRVLGLRFYEGKVLNALQTGSNEDLDICLDQHRKLMAVIKRNDKKIERLEKVLEHNEVVKKALAKSNQELLSNLQETEKNREEMREQFLSDATKLKSEIKAKTKEADKLVLKLEKSKKALIYSRGLREKECKLNTELKDKNREIQKMLDVCQTDLTKKQLQKKKSGGLLVRLIRCFLNEV